MVKGSECDGCRRYREAGTVVSRWLATEIGNAAADQIHLVATLRSCIEALSQRNQKLHPPQANAAYAMAHPAAGEDLDEQAKRLAANCPPGYEEAEAVVLRRAADMLMAKAHGRAASYRGEPRGPYRVPLRLMEPGDRDIP